MKLGDAFGHALLDHLEKGDARIVLECDDWTVSRVIPGADHVYAAVLDES